MVSYTQPNITWGIQIELSQALCDCSRDWPLKPNRLIER